MRLPESIDPHLWIHPHFTGLRFDCFFYPPSSENILLDQLPQVPSDSVIAPDRLGLFVTAPVNAVHSWSAHLLPLQSKSCCCIVCGWQNSCLSPQTCDRQHVPVPHRPCACAQWSADVSIRLSLTHKHAQRLIQESAASVRGVLRVRTAFPL